MKIFLTVAFLLMSMMTSLSASDYEDVKKRLDSAIKETGLTLSKKEYDILLKELIEEENRPKPNTTPDESWVNHTIEVTFDDAGGRSLRGKTKRLKILEYKIDSDGYSYFSVEDITGQYLKNLYTFWFDNQNAKQEPGPNIESYKFL